MYLINNVTLPTFIIKEYNPKNEKKYKNYKWLMCIDYPNKRVWNAFYKH